MEELKYGQEGYINQAEQELEKSKVFVDSLSRSALAGDLYSKELTQAKEKLEKTRMEIGLMRKFVMDTFRKAA